MLGVSIIAAYVSLVVKPFVEVGSQLQAGFKVRS